MAIDVKSKTIDGEVYEFYQLSPRKAVKILTRLLRIIGKPVGKAVGNVEGSVMDLELSGAVMGEIVASLTDKLDEDVVLDTIEQLLEPVMCDGKQVGKQFETHFAGRIGHLMKVVWAALEVNYSDFFDGGFGLGSLAKRATASKSAPAT